MISTVLTERAATAAARYGLFVSALRGIYARAIAHPEFETATLRRRMLEEAKSQSYTYLEQEISFMETDLNDVFTEAHQRTHEQVDASDREHVPALALEQLQATLVYLNDELIAQVQRDLTQLRARLQSAVLDMQVASRSRNIPLRNAQIEFRLAHATGIEFSMLDRSSRRWSSEKVVRTVWRNTLLSAYNETVMIMLADHGLTGAEVYHLDAKAGVHGMKIAFSQNEDRPAYGDIRETVFHPNANAILIREGAHVSA